MIGVEPVRYRVDQRVRIKTAHGGHNAPSESTRGAEGKIAEQLMLDWAGTRLAVEAGTPRTYYVEIDDGEVELINEEWFEVV